MYAIDLFENTNPTDQSSQIPVAPHVPGEKNRQVGNANLAALLSALNNPENPSVSIQFLDGTREVLSSAQIDLIIYYYNKVLTTKTQKANFLYRTFLSRNKLFTLLNQLEEKKALAQAGQKSFSFAPDPVNPDEVKPQQLDLFKEEKKSSKYKDVAVQRAMRQAQADFPTAASDAEAFAKSMMVQQDRDQKNIDRLKSATSRAQDLIAKNDELDQTQARSIDAIQSEIDKVEKDNNSLTQMVQQMSKANSELQQTLARMRGKTPAEPISTVAPEPQLGVSVATDKQEPAEPEAPSSPIDIGARQKLDQLSKAVTGSLLTLQNKEATQGLTPAERERLEKLEVQHAELKNQYGRLARQVNRAEVGQIPGELIRAQNDPYTRGVANASFHEDLTHGLEEELPSKATHKLQQWKNRQAQQQAQQAPTVEPVVTPAEPQPVPARLSDLQARQQKFKTLTRIKKKIEAAQKKATAGGRMLPRGLAADLEDYYTVADVDQYYDEILAKYNKQLAALNQYANMKKILNKKVTHEMRAQELEETKSSKAYDDGGREGYYGRPNRNPYKSGTQEHQDYNAGYEHFKGDKNWDAPMRRIPEDTKSEFKALALAKIKKALDNPKLDPTTKKDYEIRLAKIQALEEGRAGYNPLTSKDHWHEVERQLSNLLNNPSLDPESRAEVRQRYLEKRKEAQQKGWAK